MNEPNLARLLTWIGLPDFVAKPGKEIQDHHTGSVELCFSPAYAERAFQDAHLHRRAAERPFVDGTIPSTLDPTLMPEGVHFFSMFTQWVPDDWVREPHRAELEAYLAALRRELAGVEHAVVVEVAPQQASLGGAQRTSRDRERGIGPFGDAIRVASPCLHDRQTAEYGPTQGGLGRFAGLDADGFFQRAGIDPQPDPLTEAQKQR